MSRKIILFISTHHYYNQLKLQITGSGRDAVVIPVVNAQNKHINEMILKQKAPKSNPRSKARNIRRSRGVYDYNASYQTDYTPKSISPEPKYNFKLPDTIPDSQIKMLPPPPDYIMDLRREQCKPKNKQSRIVPAPKPQIFNEYSENNSPSTSKMSNTLNSDKVLNSLHNDVAAALSEESDYDEYFNELNFENDEDDDFYYKSDSESVDCSSSMKNLHQPIINETPIPMLDPRETSRPNHVSRVNDSVKEKLRQLISEHPDGIWCSKLLKMYQ